jgi:hypothetical protein
MTLDSEGFERAAFALRHALESFHGIDTHQLMLCMNKFEESVTRMGRIAGMQAANDQRKAIGDTMAYTEQDFLNA